LGPGANIIVKNFFKNELFKLSFDGKRYQSKAGDVWWFHYLGMTNSSVTVGATVN
jgi:hypothetical protein